MKYTKIPQNIQNRLQGLINEYAYLVPMIDAIHKNGGKVLLVGGAVRDLFLGSVSKDLDIEVHGLDLLKLEAVLRKFGVVDTVGKAFGVLRVHPYDIDWSLPRTDSSGRKPVVVVDPFMDIKQACARRDLTMNAMGIDLITNELIDPFNGLQDMQDRILRAPDPVLFIEDPLRFFRVMQFCARFEMDPDETLNNICMDMDISTVSCERIETECAKWLLKSKKPSRALDWLRAIGRVQDVFPEIAALEGVEQNPEWHPEGDVFEHTKEAVDAAAVLDYAGNKDKLIIMYGTLCHDLGKVTTTQLCDGKIISHGHAQEGVAFARSFLKRITRNKELIDAVLKIVEYHMHPLQFIESNAGLPAYKRLAKKLAPDVTLRMLAKVFLADRLGRKPKKGAPLIVAVEDVDIFISKAQKAGVLDAIEQPILHGRDFLDIVAPGKELGMLVKKAYGLQIQEGITAKEELKKRILSEFFYDSK